MSSRLYKISFLAVLFCLVTALLALAACAPQTSGEAEEATGGSGNARKAAADVAWSPDSDCTACHSVEADSQQDQTCLASIHASSQCMDCHNDESGLATQHGNVTSDSKAPTRLKKTAVTEDTCLACHGSYDGLAGKTASYTGLADKNGTVVNPHVISASADHEGITCTSCHEVHATGADAGEDAMKACMTCHHEEVFECGTCHNQ